MLSLPVLALSFSAPVEDPSSPQVGGAPCKGCAPCGVAGGYCQSAEQACCGGIDSGKCYTIGYSQCCGTSIGGTLCGLTDTCCSLGGGSTACCSPFESCNFGTCSPSPSPFGPPTPTATPWAEVDAHQSPKVDAPESPKVDVPK